LGGLLQGLKADRRTKPHKLGHPATCWMKKGLSKDNGFGHESLVRPPGQDGEKDLMKWGHGGKGESKKQRTKLP